MSSLPALMAAHQDFTWDENEPGAAEPHLLKAPRVIHAALVSAPGPEAPWFQDYVRTGTEWRALCGTVVLVITPDFYDETARGSCKRCALAVERWLDDENLIRWEWEVTEPGMVRR